MSRENPSLAEIMDYAALARMLKIGVFQDRLPGNYGSETSGSKRSVAKPTIYRDFHIKHIETVDQSEQYQSHYSTLTDQKANEDNAVQLNIEVDSDSYPSELSLSDLIHKD